MRIFHGHGEHDEFTEVHANGLPLEYIWLMREILQIKIGITIL